MAEIEALNDEDEALEAIFRMLQARRKRIDEE